MPETIPLFPLSTVLFPYGRMPLQIFEPRYLDLVSRCLKNNIGFGVVLLEQGHEVKHRETLPMQLAPVGCYAKIVDWDQLPNGLLGVTIEGQYRFRLSSVHCDDAGLYHGTVEALEDEPFIPCENDELKILLQGLMGHELVQKLHLEPDLEDAVQVSFLLSQLLPLPEESKMQLLSLSSTSERIEQIEKTINQFRTKTEH